MDESQLSWHPLHQFEETHSYYYGRAKITIGVEKTRIKNLSYIWHIPGWPAHNRLLGEMIQGNYEGWWGSRFGNEPVQWLIDRASALEFTAILQLIESGEMGWELWSNGILQK